ncbi:MAG: DUF3500 domain-containing protein [Acidobacteriia bacterium]|nr:DUF3500 domain-containing protein [Terriglobia bacterium]
MNHHAFRFGLIASAFMLLTSAYLRVPTAVTMDRAANTFLNSLTPDQKAKAAFSFQEDERLNWHFIPRVRKGLPLREMTPTQKHLAQALLAAGLSQSGYMKAITIMSLEDILRILEKDSGERRNPEGYFFSIFGEPSENGTWGYRVEGHHMAQNWTVVKGKVSDSPSFFGTNPALVKDGPRKGLRVLAAEEDAARELLMALDEGQRKTAIVNETALKDIITMASRKAALEGQPSGLSATKMSGKQLDLLHNLLEEYAGNMPEQLAEARREMIKKAGKNIFFAWTGVKEKGGPHYYRVQGPTFLVEYDNTQNDANHVHSVWRNYNGDFGLDLLAQHLRTAHR